MKILLAGNIANHAYFLAKILRKNDIDVNILIKNSPDLSEDPKKFDSKIEDYPEWVKFWNGNSKSWKRDVIKEMNRYDLVQASTELPIFSMFCRKPYVSLTTGSDIIELGHQNNIKSILLRIAWKRSKVVIVPGLYMMPSIKKLKIKNYIFLPLIWEYENQVNEVNEVFTIFHPTRHDWIFKGNDKLMRAFVELSKIKKNIHLILIKAGNDFENSLKILRNCSSDKYTIIEKRLDAAKMSQIYKRCDVVADYFNLGSMGLIGQEALRHGKPLINSVDNELFLKYYKEIPPILNAWSEKEILKHLINLIENRELSKKIGNESKKWIKKHHDTNKIIKKYIFLYDSILNKKTTAVIQNEMKWI